MAVCMYKEYARQDRESAHMSYVADQRFANLAARAESLGYRHATFAEINASAEAAQWAPELFCWQGGLWVRIK